MKRNLVAGAFALGLGLGGAPALAQEQHPYALKMSGGQFLDLCTNPPTDSGAQVVAMCQMYVAGVADALKASGRICSAPWMTPRQLFATAAWWIDTRRYDTNPVSVMVGNGLIAAFPCGPRTAGRVVPPPNAGRDQMEKITRLLEAGAPWVHLFLMLAK